MPQVRRAEIGDTADIAWVHVASWATTYRDLLPVDFIAERTLGAREAFWSGVLKEGDPNVHVFVACEADGSICGFASGGPERTGQLGLKWELYSVYLLEEAQGQGAGRALTEAVLGALAKQGANRIAVWVLGTNPARAFYERLGGRILAKRDVEMGGEWFTEVAYELGADPKV